MKIVCNASPLIILGRIGQLDLLPTLFSAVHVSGEVYQEVVIAGVGRPAAEAVKAAKWIQVHPSLPISALDPLRQGTRLGDGELATIALAKIVKADWVILDEHAARRLAVSHQLKVMGCIGVLELAYHRKLVYDLRAVYAQMLAEGVYISPSILNHSLAAFGLPAL